MTASLSPKKSKEPSILDAVGMDRLLTLVEEAARSTQEGVRHFVEPAPGTLLRATTKRHHIVFGRRGSGKSSLLRKAAADLTIDRRPIAYVNLEAFKGHSYPDVLLSILIATLVEFQKWMDSAAIHPHVHLSGKNYLGLRPSEHLSIESQPQNYPKPLPYTLKL